MCVDCKHFEVLAGGICRNPESEWLNRYVDWNDDGCDKFEEKKNEESENDK